MLGPTLGGPTRGDPGLARPGVSRSTLAGPAWPGRALSGRGLARCRPRAGLDGAARRSSRRRGLGGVVSRPARASGGGIGPGHRHTAARRTKARRRRDGAATGRSQATTFGRGPPTAGRAGRLAADGLGPPSTGRHVIARQHRLGLAGHTRVAQVMSRQHHTRGRRGRHPAAPSRHAAPGGSGLVPFAAQLKRSRCGGVIGGRRRRLGPVGRRRVFLGRVGALQPLALRPAPHPVGLCLFDARRVARDTDPHRQAQVQALLIGEAQFPRQLVNPDLPGQVVR